MLRPKLFNETLVNIFKVPIAVPKFKLRMLHILFCENAVVIVCFEEYDEFYDL